MCDIAYILRNGVSSNEIKYSLRTLSCLKHGRVFICGGLPSYINKNKVTHIKAKDSKNNKLLNAIDKIKEICNTKEVSDDFILMNDDFFFLKPVDNVKIYYNGTLDHMEKTHISKAGYYYKAIRLTLKTLRDRGIKNPLNYEVHYPIVFNKEKFLEVMSTINPEYPILFRSFYCNMLGVPGEDRNDVKAYSVVDLNRLLKTEFFSTDDSVAKTHEFIEWAESTNPSEFELFYNKGYMSMTDNSKYSKGQIIDNPTEEDIEKYGLIRVLH